MGTHGWLNPDPSKPSNEVADSDQKEKERLLRAKLLKARGLDSASGTIDCPPGVDPVAHMQHVLQNEQHHRMSRKATTDNCPVTPNNRRGW